MRRNGTRGGEGGSDGKGADGYVCVSGRVGRSVRVGMAGSWWVLVHTYAQVCGKSVHQCAHVCTRVHTCALVFTRVHTCSHVCTCVHMWAHVCTCAHSDVVRPEVARTEVTRTEVAPHGRSPPRSRAHAATMRNPTHRVQAFREVMMARTYVLRFLWLRVVEKEAQKQSGLRQNCNLRHFRSPHLPKKCAGFR